MENLFLFTQEHLNRMYPFYILINKDLNVEDMGAGISKELQIKPRQLFTDCFTILNIGLTAIKFSQLKDWAPNEITIRSTNASQQIIKGTIEFLPYSNQLLFLGIAMQTPDIRPVLAQSDKRFFEMMQQLGDNVWEHDFAIEQTIFSQNELQLLGFQAEEFKNNVDLWYQRTLEADQPLLKQNDFNYRNGLIDHHILEYRMIHKDGTIKWVLDRGVVIEKTPEGLPLKIIGTHTDITDIKNVEQQIKQSEKKYRDVVENSLALVTTHDLDGRFITVNPIVSKTLGYSNEEMIGHCLVEFLREIDQTFFDAFYLQQIRTEKRAEGVFNVLHKNGQIVNVLYNNLLMEEDGNEPYVISYATDITQRVQAEKALKAAKKVSEELAESKQNFLANMSHEIRTPMNAIIGMTTQLKKTCLSTDQDFYLNVVHTAANNLMVIINDILDLSKIEAGKINLLHIGFKPLEVFQQTMQIMTGRALEKNISIKGDFSDSLLEPVLLGDPYRLNQILLNLVSNAIKFTENGGVMVTCKVLDNQLQQQTLQMQVQDTGIGIDENFMQQIFNKFTQEDESITRRYGGTGLGMSICKELLQHMNGNISIESNKGKGTTITFTIPFEKGNSSNLPMVKISNSNTGLLKGKKILVVDDNEMNRLVANATLKNYDAEIVEATNGAEAVAILKTQSMDLVLMDIQMPVMDGIEAIRIIRSSISTTIPIIALTAFALQDDDHTFLDGEMNAYLSKPYEENHFLELVCYWLGATYQTVEKQELVIANSNSLYNLSKIQQLSNGDDSFVKQMVDIFISQVQAALPELQTALDENNLKQIKKTVHRIKPSILNMGIHSQIEVVKEIETLARQNQGSPHLYSLLHNLMEVLQQVTGMLKQQVA